MFTCRAKNIFLLVYAACAVLSLFTYSRAFDNPFRQDDFVFLSRVETVPLQDGLKPSPQFAFYRPGAIALFYLEHRLFARNSGAYIVFNYVLHLLISIFMLLVLQRLGLNREATFLASGLFLLGFGHYGKEVMWASCSGPLMSVLLSLAAILIALRWMQFTTHENVTTSAFNRILYPTAVVALLTVSPLFHEASIITAIVIAFMIAVSPRTSRAQKLKRVVVVLIPWALWLLLLSFYAQVYLAHIQIKQAALDAPLYMIRYAGFMVFPLQQTHLIEPDQMLTRLMKAAQVLHIIGGSILLAVFIWLALRARASLRILAVWVLCALFPFTLLKMPGSRLELRYFYYASIPFCGLAATAVLALATQKRAIFKIIAGAVLIGVTAGSMVLVLLLESSYG